MGRRHLAQFLVWALRVAHRIPEAPKAKSVAERALFPVFCLLLLTDTECIS